MSMTLSGMTERRKYPIRLTGAAREGWDAYCTRERVTMTALIESLGLELAERHDVIPPSVVERAAAIDRHRKSRR